MQQLQQNIVIATVEDLLEYNRIVGRAHRDSNVHMKFPNLGVKRAEDLVVLAWGDSSLANVTDPGAKEKLATQAGLVVDW